MRWLFGPPKDEVETTRLIAEARRLRATSRFHTVEAQREFIVELLIEACVECDVCVSAPVAQHLGHICLELFKAVAFTFDPDAIPPVLETLDAGVKLRERLRGVITILQHEAHYLAVWRRKLLVILVGLLNDLPVNALVDPALDGTVETASVLRPETPLALLVDDLPVSLTKLMGTFDAAQRLHDRLALLVIVIHHHAVEGAHRDDRRDRPGDDGGRRQRDKKPGPTLAIPGGRRLVIQCNAHFSAATGRWFLHADSGKDRPLP